MSDVNLSQPPQFADSFVRVVGLVTVWASMADHGVTMVYCALTGEGDASKASGLALDRRIRRIRQSCDVADVLDWLDEAKYGLGERDRVVHALWQVRRSTPDSVEVTGATHLRTGDKWADPDGLEQALEGLSEMLQAAALALPICASEILESR